MAEPAVREDDVDGPVGGAGHRRVAAVVDPLDHPIGPGLHGVHDLVVPAREDDVRIAAGVEADLRIPGQGPGARRLDGLVDPAAAPRAEEVVEAVVRDVDHVVVAGRVGPMVRRRREADGRGGADVGQRPVHGDADVHLAGARRAAHRAGLHALVVDAIAAVAAAPGGGDEHVAFAAGRGGRAADGLTPAAGGLADVVGRARVVVVAALTGARLVDALAAGALALRVLAGVAGGAAVRGLAAALRNEHVEAAVHGGVAVAPVGDGAIRAAGVGEGEVAGVGQATGGDPRRHHQDPTRAPHRGQCGPPARARQSAHD